MKPPRPPSSSKPPGFKTLNYWESERWEHTETVHGDAVANTRATQQEGQSLIRTTIKQLQ